MYGAFVSVKLQGDLDAARKALNEEVVPMVRSAPGFVAGYWFEPRDGQGWSVALFETEEQARSAAPKAGTSPTPFATVDTVEFREVVAQA